MASLKPHVYQGVADDGSVTIPNSRTSAKHEGSHEHESRCLELPSVAARASCHPAAWRGHIGGGAV